VSRKTNRLKARIAVIESQDRRRKAAIAEMKNVAVEASRAEFNAKTALKKLEEQTALRITVDEPVGYHHPDLLQLTVTMDPRAFELSIFHRRGMVMENVRSHARNIAYDAAKKIEDALVQYITKNFPGVISDGR
jgi:hypothetical protein